MTGRMFAQPFTVPAKTAITAPVTAQFPLPTGHIAAITIVIPNGHNGLTGMQVLWGGVQIMPYGTGQWVVSNNTEVTEPVDQDISQNSMTLAGYNTDVFPHTFQVRAQWVSPAPVPTSSAQLASASADQVAAVTDQVTTLADLGPSLGDASPPVLTPVDVTVTLPPFTGGPPGAPPPPPRTVVITADGRLLLRDIAKAHKNTLVEAQRLNHWAARYVGHRLPRGSKVTLYRR